MSANAKVRLCANNQWDVLTKMSASMMMPPQRSCLCVKTRNSFASIAALYATENSIVGHMTKLMNKIVSVIIITLSRKMFSLLNLLQALSSTTQHSTFYWGPLYSLPSQEAFSTIASPNPARENHRQRVTRPMEEAEKTYPSEPPLMSCSLGIL